MTTSTNKLEKQIESLTDRLDRLSDQFANFKSNTAQHIALSEKVNKRTHRILDNLAELRTDIQRMAELGVLMTEERQKP